ncbi:DUF3139 domain-containing protein [Paenibacillus sp. FA6]|uniref:DUF3139 domain-containing protein n=1 Tax=Paenibacillus sp. FA6 TaxID=3413029 RepID=UPI003F65FF7D
MGKKDVMITMIIFLMVAGIGLQLFKNNMNREVKSYLLEEKEYTEVDIYKIYTQVGKAPLVSTTVIFNDERRSRYFYRKENGRIYQYSRAPLNGVDVGHIRYKHEEDY